jgi:hypothetical protein
MDDQRTDREGGIKAPQFRLRFMLLIVALCAVVFAWIGVQHQRERIRLMGELTSKEYARKLFTDDNIVPGREALRKQEVWKLRT